MDEIVWDLEPADFIQGVLGAEPIEEEPSSQMARRSSKKPYRMDLMYTMIPRQLRVLTDFEHSFIKDKGKRPNTLKRSQQGDRARWVKLEARPASAPVAIQKRKRDTSHDDGPKLKRQFVRKASGGNAPGTGAGRSSTPTSQTGTPSPPADSEQAGEDSGGRALTEHEALAVRYMNNLMSSELRSFGIGLLVEADSMRLWYGDRMGFIVSKALKWLEEDNRTFLRCITAIAQASAHGMGIHPYLQFLNRGQATDTNSYEGAYLSMTARRPDVDEDEELEFALDVKGPLVYAEYGLVGRGTRVMPVVAKPGTKAHELFQDEDLVAKISWPNAARRAEDSVVLVVRKALKSKKPQYLPYIVDLKCSTTRTIDELGIPRAKLNILPDQSDLRVCRTLVMKRYQRLEMVESVDDFKKVFIDIVRGTSLLVTSGFTF